MSRPHLSASIVELECIFSTAEGDRKVLKTLLAELSQRSTERAGRLKAKVIAALEGLETAKAPPRASTASPPPPKPPEPPQPTAPKAPPPEPKPEAKPSTPPPWLDRGPRRPPPPVRDRAEDVLSAWTALEVLSPVTYRKPVDMADGDARRIALLDGGLPWRPPSEKAKPNKQLFYQIVLGAVRMDEATNALLSVFVDKHQDRPVARGMAAVATVTVDKAGVLVEEGAATALSSFAWGLPLALKQDLVGLGRWPEVETKLNEDLDRRLRRVDDEGKPVPLDAAAIRGAYDWLVGTLGLHPSLVEGPTFAIRVYHYWKAQDPPDAPLMGSFFLEDLAAVRKLVTVGTVPAALRSYLGITKRTERKDVLAGEAVIAASVAPGRFPPGRWPAPGRHPLVLLQQGAVNVAMSDLPCIDLFPVNGPPGTGKTTLLRDMVAALVVRRAEAMCAFDAPEKAFPATGAKPKVGTATVPIHRVDERLRGFEMLVASSNNKAVENVSRELPALKAIADDAGTLRYFKTVADKVGGGVEAWGLIAAVLGNASNRFAFRETAWMDPDHGLRTYLAEVAGSPQWIEEPDPSAPGKVRKRRPLVIDRESPPRNRTEALKRWQDARAAFQAEVAKVRKFLSEIEAARKEVGTLPELRAAAARASRAADTAEEATATAKQDHQDAVTEASRTKHVRERARQALDAHQAGRPGFFARTFGTRSARDWSTSNDQLGAVLERADREASDAAARSASAQGRHGAAEKARKAADREFQQAVAIRDQAEERVALMRRRCGARAVDAAFFARDREVLHLAAPWLDATAHRERDRVFELALAVHKAFIDAAAVPVRSNLENLFKALIGRNAWQPKTRPHMPDLWATLFLVVPVISTTFASVTRMLGYLPPETLGWLLVDEAGQAVPQAVVGAMMRTKRSVVVGDPLQIEPVTSLPTELAETICADFGVDTERWNAPKASVQAVADASATFVAEFQQTVGSVQVGFPLLVHRRCADPMFSLSNSVAYSNLMVHATPSRASAIRDVLGPSRWVDVVGGRTEDKWSEAEGAAVIAMLRRLSDAGVAEPDLYVVTPFVIVAQQLRERVMKSGLLQRWTSDPYAWTRDRIGTVHTVQGREADTVILVLGAPLPTQRGARGWAGGYPNLLNVAVTRAKENLYVVGSQDAWREAGVFRHLAARLPAGAETPEPI